ncbi:MAG: sugar isomerase [Planctomycetes bacterium]|nr:sugar isomerase [Planctomycetota bacterium]
MKNEQRYTKYALAREMMETPDVIRNFKLENAELAIKAIQSKRKLFFTGEGSSRIFPAKNAIRSTLRTGIDLQLAAEGARQASEYDLSSFVVFAASNSGSTKEVIALLDQLKKQGHENLFGLTAREDTKLAQYANQTFVLSCGWEQAVAATKSTAEQALLYQELLAQVQGTSLSSRLSQLADATEQALTISIDPEIIQTIADADTIYFAGRQDGVAEELTLKTNEITRKKSDYLEGTYAVHGIEEVLTPNDVVILIDPFEAELSKFKEVLVDGVGMSVIAVSDTETIFQTMKVDPVADLQNFVYLAAGWNILVEVGLLLGIDLDTPQRARKIGNEFIP